MNIPKTIKLGGVRYTVEITDKLNLGNANYSAEIDYLILTIRICPTVPQKQEVDFLHELLHAIADHLGYKDHDEKKIDELAHALYMVIEDNPGLFAPPEKPESFKPSKGARP